MSADNKKDYLQTSTVHELPTPDPRSTSASSDLPAFSYNNTVHRKLSADESIELVRKSTGASVEIHDDDEPHHEPYAHSGSVQELQTPKAVAPQSPTDSEDKNFPDTNIDNITYSIDLQSNDDRHPSVGSVGSIGSDGDIKKKDFEDRKNRMEAAHKLDMTPINESQEENYATVLAHSHSSIHGENKFTASTNLQNQDFYRINKRFVRGYIRQDWHTYCVDDGLDELRAGWVELFFDLIFVACIVHLSAESSYSIKFPGEELNHRRRMGINNDNNCNDGMYDFLITSFAQFALLSAFWMEQVMYTTHFVLNEHVDELLRIIYMTCVLAMGIFIANDTAYHIGFFCSYALTRIVSICMFLRVLFIPRARSHAIYHIILHVLILLVLIGLIGFRFNGCALEYFAIYFSLWLVEYLSGVFQWSLTNIFCKEEKKKYAIALPLNVPHISERYGLFVMTILGETLIAIMTTDIGSLDLYQKFAWKSDGTPPDLIKVFFFLGIFISCYCIGRLYYNCQPSEEAILVGTKNHALRISKSRARVYIHSHQILFMALLGYGIGVKLAGKHVLSLQRRWIDILLPGYSLFIIVICLNIIRAAHPFDANKKVWTFRFIIIIILGIIPLFAIMINQAFIWIVQLICILGLVATDVEGEQKRIDEKHHEQKKRDAAKEHAELKEKAEKEKKSFRKHLRHMVSGIGLL